MKNVLFAVMVGFVVTTSIHADDVYTSHCAKCHGSDGKGQTPIGKKLVIKDISTKESWNNISDTNAIIAVTSGVKKDNVFRMKAFGETLTPEQISNAVKEFKSLTK